MASLMAIAHRYNLAVIEDACEAIGATYDSQQVGTFGDISVFAFYPNKQMTTSEGGAILCRDGRPREAYARSAQSGPLSLRRMAAAQRNRV